MAATPDAVFAPGARQGSLTDWTTVVRKLGPGFASRAAGYDANDSFVAENYIELKEHKVFSVGVPAELGGGGASHAELCGLLREMGRYCSSTALALSMHTHLVGTLTWMWRQGRPVAPLLQRIAANELVLVTTGASDWLDSSGNAERVDGGFRVTGRKIFGSGSPMGDLLVTSAPYDDPNEGPTVLHFAVPMNSEGLTVLDNWRAMGMRATGSNDILLEGVFVPDAAVQLRRPQGVWHPLFNAIAAIALPIVLSVYLGVAEASRELTLRQVAKKRDDPEVWSLVGEMENALATGQMAVKEMVQLCADYTFAPEVATANAVFIRKAIAAESLRLTVEKALETVGGGGFFRSMGLERLLRDIQAAQFHPLQAKRQHRFTGRVALGLDPVGKGEL
jgi:alkylation response protein AidB-like acyl-CoA dehydrogenase